MLTLWLVFRLALRQADAFAASVLRLFGCELPIPDEPSCRDTAAVISLGFAGY